MVKLTREEDEQALADPRAFLLERKLKTFLLDSGLNEINFASYCAYHLAHPTLPPIDRQYNICLMLEIDPLKSTKPLREQVRFVQYDFATEEDVERGENLSFKEQREVARLEMADQERRYRTDKPLAEAGLHRATCKTFLAGYWKGEPRSTFIQVSIVNPFVVRKVPRSSTREYEAIIADWFPFLQKSMESPPLSFRHLFDSKVDEATRSFDFGERAERNAGLPSRKSPRYALAREAMFQSEELERNIKRQEDSIPREYFHRLR
jgi:hypothetical protein